MIKDNDIRDLLHKEFKSNKTSLNRICMDEVGLCQSQSIVDIAIITDTIHGIEIKSEADTLNRLAQQMDTYNKCLRYITIVTCENHLSKVLEIVPSFWGVKLVKYDNNILQIETIREEKENINVDKYSFVQLLWKDETFNILKDMNLSKGMASKTRKILWDKLADNMDTLELETLVCNTLRNRTNWRDKPLQIKREHNKKKKLINKNAD